MTCQSVSYFGMTITTLKKRLDSHYYNGSIFQHYKQNHKESITKQNLYNNTLILEKEQDWRKLAIKEALKIIELTPKWNIQFKKLSSILKLYKNRDLTQVKYNEKEQDTPQTNNETTRSMITPIYTATNKRAHYHQKVRIVR